MIYKPLKQQTPLTEIHLAWRRGDELPALRVFVDLAVGLAAKGQPSESVSR